MNKNHIHHKPLTLNSQGQLEKDAAGSPMTQGFLYRTGGFWSLAVDEVVSDVVSGGSDLMNWLPTRGVDTVESRVAHLAWVGPQGYNGEQTYMEYLAALADAGECGYGPSDDWNGFEYNHSGHDVSRTSPTMQPVDWGQRYVDKQPILRVRGDNVGLPLENDAMWALARAGIGLENHLNWNIIFGDPDVAKYTYHGLDVILQPGWVQSRLVGQGQPVFADPLVLSGVALDTPEKILQKFKGMVRKILNRMGQRGYRATSNDVVAVMPGAIWTYLADSIAHGSLMATAPTSMTVNITPEGFFRERERVTSGYFGYGFIPVDNFMVPVIVDDTMGANVTLADGSAGVTGDIFFLTRYFKGITILEHQYFNWNAVQGYPAINETIMQNGMLRAGWINEANKCFKYYIEMKARILSTMQPFQGRINDITVKTILENENEAGNPASQDWYAFGGRRGGAGVKLIQGLM